MTIRPSTSALDLARHLLGSEPGGTPDPAASGAALERTLARVSKNLRRSIGDDGYAALLARAIEQTEPQHPVLTEIRGNGVDGFAIDRAATVGSHNIQIISAAIESLLASIIDLLSSLIGADMVMNLLDHDGISQESPRSGELQ